MINFYDFAHVRFAVLVTAIFLSGCNVSDLISVSISTKYDPVFFGRDIQVSLNNKSKYAVCLLKRDLDPTLPSFEVYQNNQAILPNRQSNREIVPFNGTDVSGGIEVIPSGTRNFFINTSDFALKPGKFFITIRVKVAKCADIFSTKKVEWHVLTGKVAGSIS